jgi:hypothetical protein
VCCLSLSFMRAGKLCRCAYAHLQRMGLVVISKE